MARTKLIYFGSKYSSLCSDLCTCQYFSASLKLFNSWAGTSGGSSNIIGTIFWI